MSQANKIFFAPSPKDGKSRKWEALEEMGTADPYEFFSIDIGEEEKYTPKDEGHQPLLAEYKKSYPHS